MSHNMQQLIQDYGLIAPGDHVICALSGGKDSMCLLHMLLELQPQLDFHLSAAHFNHRLRGEESLRDEKFVVDYCKRLGISLQVGSGDVSAFAAIQKIGLEEAARTLRYQFLLSLSPNAKIATAHNAQDNLETMLMHMLRGCGTGGLSGIPPNRGRIIRPLLTTDRDFIEDYLTTHHIPHVEDSTNATDFCLRNRLRHHVLPLLTTENPNLPRTAAALSLELRQTEDYLNTLAQQELSRIRSGKRIHIPLLGQLPEIMQSRVLKLYLQEVPQLQRNHLMHCRRILVSSAPSAAITLPGGYQFRREYEYAVLEKSACTPPPACVTIGAGESVSFGPWQVTCRRGPATSGIIALKIPPGGRVTLRCRKQGDRIHLSGGTKKLSRYLMDKKIPALQRDTLPVVLWDGILAAVLPLGADTHFSQVPGKDSLIFTVNRMEEVK